MIFPFLKGIASYAEAPFTWTLVYLNVFLFCAAFLGQKHIEAELEKMWTDTEFVETTGRAFAAYLRENPDQAKKLHRQLIRLSDAGDATRTQILANMAFRQEEFLRTGETLELEGDQVAIQVWRKQFKKFRETQFSHPSYIWGLSSRAQGWMQYLSYQFAHGSFFHLIGNMFFLLIFGTFIEMSFGSLVFLSGYLVSGFVAAIGFVLWSGIGYSPLIGASGAVSGLMAFVAIMYRDRNIPYAYFVLPVHNYFGMIYLPGWTILLLWLVTDVAGVMSNLSEFGGVAHSAHIGGAIAGILFAHVIEQAKMPVPSAIT